MSVVNNNKEDRLEANRTLLKAVIQMCRLGGDFYNLIGQNIKHYAIKQVCFDMAKSYFKQIPELVEIAQDRYQLSEQETMTSTSIEDYYHNILSKQVKLNPPDLLKHLIEVEEQHLAELNNAIDATSELDVKGAISKVVAQIIVTYQKLTDLTHSISDNQTS
ncbi:hypothetical protein Q4567_11110 [Aliiglaciecola sp. 2_MG-2023]|uniref:hypothetical protein n=1 Tax=Alteromonadaceae TaxID=72275 RepID=UPI0026E3CD70|nr:MULTISPECIES: hypothetical protein [unclassified Aliiglaciecola]MDO6711274.1 hypothetical protein [Aliiglaciecola sp. 2_MG-2023]MDO6752277.1 hypothetical protein [Aliiglaciecola sp. 1_MG-2023]